MHIDSSEIRKHELKITEQAKTINSAQVLDFEKSVEDREKSWEERLELFWILLTRYRRNKDISKCLQLYLKHQQDFGEEFLSKHLYSSILCETNQLEKLEEAVSLAKSAVSMNPWYSGALHNLARSLSTLIEAANIEGKEKERLCRDALKNVNKALLIEPGYAKFYSTRAKIKAQAGHFDAAEDDIQAAIELEDSDSIDYPIRISDYLEIKNMVALKKLKATINNEISNTVQDALGESKKLNIQILTLFVAVISFIFGGITIATNYSFIEAMRLIFVLSSALLLSLTGFGILYDRKVSFSRVGLAVVFAAVLLALASQSERFL